MTQFNADAKRMLGIIARYHERNDVWPTESEIKMLTGPHQTSHWGARGPCYFVDAKPKRTQSTRHYQTNTLWIKTKEPRHITRALMSLLSTNYDATSAKLALC